MYIKYFHPEAGRIKKASSKARGNSQISGDKILPFTGADDGGVAGTTPAFLFHATGSGADPNQFPLLGKNGRSRSR
jgi:hypothetical protein